jgi:hypothetical protein
MIDGWDGSMWKRDLDAPKDDDAEHDMMSEYAVVYTDIQAPDPKPFNTANIQMLAGVETLTVDDREIEEVDLVNEGYGTHVMLDVATTPATQTFTGVEDEDETDDQMMFKLSFTGSFGGAMGEYSCAGNSADICSVMIDSDGDITGTPAGDWTFKAAEDAMVMLPDTDYLWFGWWVNGPTGPNDDDDYSYMFQTAAGGPASFPTNALTALMTGSADYEGAAAGKYVIKTVSDGVIQRADMGKFTADVSLTADFEFDYVGGSVTNFMAGEEMMDDWHVMLRNVGIPADNTPFAGRTNATVSGMDNMKKDAGTWQGSFFGPGADDAMPSGVAGRFDAHFDAAHLAGSFGAEKE